MTDLYTRIGGELAVTAAVPLFYERLLADDELARFFDLNLKLQNCLQSRPSSPEKTSD